MAKNAEMKVRVFFIVGDEDVTEPLLVDAVPRVGEMVWIKTGEVVYRLVVLEVEHQFDRSTSAGWSNQDVLLRCNVRI